LREIEAAKALLRQGHPEVQGLCRALADWSREAAVIREELWRGN
jgi:hypothetical protein